MTVTVTHIIVGGTAVALTVTALYTMPAWTSWVGFQVLRGLAGLEWALNGKQEHHDWRKRAAAGRRQVPWPYRPGAPLTAAEKREFDLYAQELRPAQREEQP